MTTRYAGSIKALILCAASIASCASAEGQAQLDLIGMDDSTGTRFSRPLGADRCPWMGDFRIIGEVPPGVSLADEAIANAIVESARDVAIKACPDFNLTSGEPHVYLFRDKYNGPDQPPEVHAEWGRVEAARFHREAISKPPTRTENKALERLRRDQLARERAAAGIDASTIAVASIEKLDTSSSFPRYSPDGSQIVYSRSVSQPGMSYQMQVIKDVKTRRTARTFGQFCISYKPAWSPNSKRIAYFAAPRCSSGRVTQPYLHIFDLSAGRDIALDYPEKPGTFLVWPSDQQLYIVGSPGMVPLDLESLIHGAVATSLDLESLKESRLPLDVLQRLQKNSVHQSWFDLRHKYCYIYRQEARQGEPFLVVANTDDSYSHVLVTGVYDQHTWVVAPDLSSLVLEQSGDLRIVYLGRRPAPVMRWRAELSSDETLAKLGSLLQEDRRVWATVFGPRVNPLNQRVVGPDEKLFKGYVKLVGVERSGVLFATTFERLQFSNGDVVSEIYAADGSLGRNLYGQVTLELWGLIAPAP